MVLYSCVVLDVSAVGSVACLVFCVKHSIAYCDVAAFCFFAFLFGLSARVLSCSVPWCEVALRCFFVAFSFGTLRRGFSLSLITGF